MGKIDNSLTWWDGASGAEAIPHHGHRGRLRGIAFSPRGNHVTTLAGDAQVITWDATTGALLRRLSLAEGDRSIFLFNRLSLSADGSLAAGIDGKDDRLRFWDLTTGKVARQVDIELWSSLNVDFSVTGAAIVARSVQGGAICWDSVTGRERGRIDPGSTVRSGEFALSPDGSLFARSFVDYDAETKRASGVNDVLGLPGARKLYALQHPTNSFFPALAFSTDGRLLAGAVNASVRNRGEHFVQLFDTRAGGEVKRLCPVQHDAKGLVSALVFAPDGRTLALALHMGQGGSETIIAVWELASGGLRHMFRGRQGRIEALAISADGATLASGGSDATVLLWETSGRPAAPAPLSPEALQAAWSDLASPDAGTGFRALGRLLGTPAQAVALLKQHLKPVAPVDVDETQVPRWLSELDSSDFARRDAARRSLAALGRRAEPALRKAQMVESTLEHRRQVESLLKLIDAQALSLREARALEVLERLREPESAAILASLAAGDASALLTHEARRVLARLRHE
jgi:WD40 repeat protein